MSERPSRLELARLVSGDLPEEEARRVRAAVESSESLRRELLELSANVEAYEEPTQRARLLARLERERPARSRSRWWWALAPAAATAVALLLLLLPSSVSHPPGGALAPQVSFKGQLAVRVVARRGGLQLVVGPGVAVAPGDALRFVVTTAAPGYLAVLSIDGRRSLSPFYPAVPAARDPRPLRLSRAGRHELEGSVVLDDAPGPEQLIVVFSPRPFERDGVERRLLELARAGTEPSAATVKIEGEVWSMRVAKQGGAR